MILLEKAFDGLLADVFSAGRVPVGVSYCSPKAFALVSVLEAAFVVSDPLA